MTVEPKPAPFVKEMLDAAQFYTFDPDLRRSSLSARSNRVIKDFKDTDAQHVEWAKAFIAILQEVHDYVKKTHTTGVTWNAKGSDAACAHAFASHVFVTRAAAPAAAPAPAAAAAPKPAAPAAAAAPADVKTGLFSELGKVRRRHDATGVTCCRAPRV